MAKYKRLQGAIKALEQELGSEEKGAGLRWKLAQARKWVALAQARRLAAENQDRLNRFFKRFDTKTERAKEISATIEKLKALFDLALDDDRKAIETWPGTAFPPDGWGLGLGPHATARMFGQEQWRLCRDESNLLTGAVQYPGPVSGRSELSGQPGRAGVSEQMMFPSLEARLTACRQVALDVLTGARTDFGRIGITTAVDGPNATTEDEEF